MLRLKIDDNSVLGQSKIRMVIKREEGVKRNDVSGRIKEKRLRE